MNHIDLPDNEVEDDLHIAVVLAGGVGTRFGADVPKQLSMLQGQTILGHTLRALSGEETFDLFRIVANSEWRTEIEAVVESALPPGMEYEIVPGGASRNESVWNAIKDLPGRSGTCIVHDGVRPLVRLSLLRSVRDSLSTHTAIVPIIDAVDPLFFVKDGIVQAIGDRRSIFRGQSPQGFNLKILWQTLASLGVLNMGQYETLYEALFHVYPNARIGTVNGDPDNIKVTKSVDRFIVNSILSEEMR